MYPQNIQKVGLIANYRVEDQKQFLEEVHNFLIEQKLEVFMDETVAKTLGSPSQAIEHSDMMQKVDLVVVMGGDGTLLTAAGSLSEKPVYAYGINFGTLGFFAESQPEETISGLKSILAGEFFLDKRCLLKVEIYRKGDLVDSGIALNEMVINQGIKARIIQLDISVGGQKVNTYRADGLIVSTPSGSTGHSLSAGGPIVTPQIDAFIITPICAFSLSNRPIVIPTKEAVTISVETFRDYEERIALTLDGQKTFDLEYEDQIKISQAIPKLALVRLKEHDYYETLRSKLSWG